MRSNQLSDDATLTNIMCRMKCVRVGTLFAATDVPPHLIQFRAGSEQKQQQRHQPYDTQLSQVARARAQTCILDAE